MWKNAGKDSKKTQKPKAGGCTAVPATAKTLNFTKNLPKTGFLNENNQNVACAL